MDIEKNNSAVEKTESIASGETETVGARGAGHVDENSKSGVKRTKTGVSATDAKYKREQLRVQREIEREKAAAERA
ncbi:MAG: hypothetical protein J6U35_01990, partial [Clostridia bacterium]|nr:hypothetical protein [Clostridia bacterium]